MKTIYSPSNIEVLLHCHTCPKQHERLDAPAVKDAILEFLDMGVIEQCSGTDAGEYIYQTTPLGKAWVAALCNVPPPRIAYVDELGRIIEP